MNVLSPNVLRPRLLAYKARRTAEMKYTGLLFSQY
jgi:hypothetical protein